MNNFNDITKRKRDDVDNIIENDTKKPGPG